MPPEKACAIMSVIDLPTPPRLSKQLGRYRYDPLGFVKFAFP
jgi:hypothetical protein